MEALAAGHDAAVQPKSHARTFIAAEHPSQLSCG
jgi:hypothetical protein